jgi:tRNA nucleotidyltransferase/poly(A) polymerase
MGDIYDDLSRRDFTMNAIAVDMQSGDFIDPHNGRMDIESRFIRCVGDTTERFSEDSLRILRAIRFSITKEFRMSDAIHAALHNRSIVSKLINVSQDRIREEVNKCFRFNTYQTLLTFQHYPIVQEYVFGNNSMWLEATNKSR